MRAMRGRDQHEASKIIRRRRRRQDEPSYSRLFTHQMWSTYLRPSSRVPTFSRWWQVLTSWQHSTVLRGVMPLMLVMALWSLFVSLLEMHFPAAFASTVAVRPITALPVELQATATGLLLVFRTNNGYERLAEARADLGRALCLTREIAQTIACEWPLTPVYEEPQYGGGKTGWPQGSGSIAGVVGGDMAAGTIFPGALGALPCEAAMHVVRYLVAFAWSLKATLREPVMEESRAEDVLNAMLPPAEVQYLMHAPNVPVALLGRLRMLLADEQRAGRLQQHVHLKLEEDLRDLHVLVADNQRLFHSPIPPTMSRHVTRCLLLWLIGLPLVLSGRLPPVAAAVATAVTTFIFAGIEEIGAQVEQPFEIMPLWQLCHLMAHDAEAAIAGDAPGHVEGIF